MGAVCREMGTVALGWGRRACSRSSCSKQAGKQGVKSGDVAFPIGGSVLFPPCTAKRLKIAKSFFIFGFLDWVHLGFSREKWF